MAMTPSGRVLVALTRLTGALSRISRNLLFSGRDRLSTSFPSESPASPSSRLSLPRHPYPETLHHTLWASPRGPTLLTRSLHTSIARFHDSRPLGKQPPGSTSPHTDPKPPPPSSSPPEAPNRPPAPVATKPVYQRAVDELKHYYHGFRQLVVDTREAGATVRRLLQGETLGRREGIRLRKTGADLVRLVPLMPFMVTPFAGPLLLVLVKLFPDMLPSTFEKPSDREQKRIQEEAAKCELRRLLLEALRPKQLTRRNSGSDGQHHGTGREDAAALTLENLERPVLTAMSGLLGLRPSFGTNSMLRVWLQAQLARLRADDEAIVAEGGPAALTVEELEAACHQRGMPSVGMEAEQLRAQLQRWLDLHLHENGLPPVLLLYRALEPCDNSFDEK